MNKTWNTLLFIWMVILLSSMVSTSIFTDNVEANFTAGVQYQTEWNNTGFLQLEGTNTTGNYTSQTFDAGSNANWTSIKWTSTCGELNIDESPYCTPEIDYIGLVGLWHLNNGTTDSSGLGNDGTNNGADCGTSVSGKINMSCDFELSDNDYIDVASDNSIEISYPTYCIWAKSETAGTSFADSVTLFNKDNTNPGTFNIVYNAPDDVLKSQIRLDGSEATARQTVANVGNLDTNWHHYCLRYNGTEQAMFIDGVKQADTNEVTGVIDNDNAGVLRIGWHPDGSADSWDGKIDEVAIWNRSLSASEIETLYFRGATRLNLSYRNATSGDWTQAETYSPVTFDLTGQYLEYKFDFESDVAGLSPKLYNVSIGFEGNVTPPAPSPPADNSLQYVVRLKLEFFCLFLGLSLCLIAVGLFKQEESAQALIGFFILFLLSLSVIGGMIDYKSGETDTKTYTYSGSEIDTVSHSVEDTYTAYDDITTHNFGYWLGIASALGFVMTIIGLKGGFRYGE